MATIELISYTNNSDKLCSNIASICYNTEVKDYKTYLRKIMNSGHLSIVEHAVFTFLIKDVSRVTTHQLVRHRIASYTQQSLRYTKATNSFLPDSIKDIPEVISTMKILDDLYNRLLSLDIPKEDARYVLPNAITSNIFVTMNARELLNFFSLRTCVKAQKEIRDIANEMLKLVKEVAPVIFLKAGPSCVNGRCPEMKPCSNISDIRKSYLSEV